MNHRCAGLLLVLGAACTGQSRLRTDETRERAPSAPPRPLLVLGRVVDLARMTAELTATQAPPDEEFTVPEQDAAVALLHFDWMEGVKLSTGELLWRALPEAPCDRIQLGGGRLYGRCGDKLLAFSLVTGVATVVDPGPGVRKAIVNGSMVASFREDGVVTLYEAVTGVRVAQKKLSEMVGRGGYVTLVPSPAATGLCALIMQRKASMPEGVFYTAGCWDRDLGRLWQRNVVMSPPAEAGYDVRQLGPWHAVFHDQPIWGDDYDPSRRHGVLLRWRDGELTQLDDGTFATLEDRAGQRIVSPELAGVFDRAASLPIVEHEGFPRRDAQVVPDGNRVYALIRNESSGLAGIDRANGRLLFLVPLPLGNLHASLEVVNGFPVVRTIYRDRWRATIHDPTDGRVLYRDQRP